MNNRYIERYRLPGSRYTRTSPVILAAGALLEDAENPRLVVQLKLRSVSPKTISGLRVQVRSLDADGNAIDAIEFTYKNLRARRGQEFGRYTAIALPLSEARRFTAVVTAAVFADSGRWERPERDALPLAVAPSAPTAEISVSEIQPLPIVPNATAPAIAAPSPPAKARVRRERSPVNKKLLAICGALAVIIVAAIVAVPRFIPNNDGTAKPSADPTVTSPTDSSAVTESVGEANNASPAPPGSSPTTGGGAEDAEDDAAKGPVRDASIYDSQTLIDMRLTELYSGGKPASSDFAVTVGGAPNPVASVEIKEWWQVETDKKTRIILMLQNPVQPGDTDILISYAPGAEPFVSASGEPLQSFDGITVENRLNLVWVECLEALTRYDFNINSLDQDTFDITLRGTVRDGMFLRVSDGSFISVELGSVLIGESETSGIIVEGRGRVVFPDDGVTLYQGTYKWSREYGWGTAENPTALNESQSGGSESASRDVRFEINANSPLQLVWYAPTWAADNTYALIEARQDGGVWTVAQRVPVRNDTRRAVSSLILPWSEPRDGSVYEFRVVFAERNGSGQEFERRETVACPGFVTVNIAGDPFEVTGVYESDGSLTVNGEFKADREYYMNYKSSGGYQSWTGFATGSQSALESYTVPARNITENLSGGSLYAWELSEPELSGSGASVTISAKPSAGAIE